jgi:hypothetical protein
MHDSFGEDEHSHTVQIRKTDHLKSENYELLFCWGMITHVACFFVKCPLPIVLDGSDLTLALDFWHGRCGPPDYQQVFVASTDVSRTIIPRMSSSLARKGELLESNINT